MKYLFPEIPVEPCPSGHPAMVTGAAYVSGRKTYKVRCNTNLPHLHGSWCYIGPERATPEEAAHAWNKQRTPVEPTQNANKEPTLNNTTVYYTKLVRQRLLALFYKWDLQRGYDDIDWNDKVKDITEKVLSVIPPTELLRVRNALNSLSIK
jgi:hypothetical protein